MLFIDLLKLSSLFLLISNQHWKLMWYVQFLKWLNKEVFDQPQKNFCIRDVKLKLIWLDKLKIGENFAKEG